MNTKVLFAVLALAAVASADLVVHTGDAFADYGGDPRYTYIPDKHNNIVNEFNPSPWSGESNDVGVPTGIDSRSGWDMRAVYVNYDRQTDTMQVGIDCYGICGDPDGNGDPNTSGSVLLANGGSDKVDFTSSETIAFLIDTRTPVTASTFDFLPTIAVGWPGEVGSTADFQIYDFDPNLRFSPPGGFGSIITTSTQVTVSYFAPVTGSASSVTDVEFDIQPWTALPGFEGLDIILSDIEFKFNVFAGSFEDDGVGEDWIFDQGNGEPFLQEGCDPDECNLCPTDNGYLEGKDDCDLCPFDELYNNAKDECDVCFGTGEDDCGFCPSHPDYGLEEDDCGLCPDSSLYGNARDDCGICFGTGRDECDLCPGDLGYGNAEDECGICFGSGVDECGLCPSHPQFENAQDDCGICFGTGRDECELCPGDESYGNAQDSCGICFGSGRDECLLCPFDEGFNLDVCYDCNNVPFGDWEYNRCGMCLPPASAGEDNDDLCPCYFDTYKGFAKWDLDRIILYYNIHATLWWTIEIKDQVADTIEDIYWYNWTGDAEAQPIDFDFWCQWIHSWHLDCLSPFTEAWMIYVSDLANSNWFGFGYYN